jgi:hypothetical protein
MVSRGPFRGLLEQVGARNGPFPAARGKKFANRWIGKLLKTFKEQLLVGTVTAACHPSEETPVSQESKDCAGVEQRARRKSSIAKLSLDHRVLIFSQTFLPRAG